MAKYKWGLVPRLARLIELGRADEAHRTMAALLPEYERAHRPLLYRKFRCVQTISHCIRAALRAGASSDVLLDDHVRRLETIVSLRSWKSVATFMHGYIDFLLSQMRQANRTDIERAVRWMRKDMGTRLEAPRSLSEYAAHLRVSREHLSRAFHAHAGRTFREEIKRLRMEEAGHLLRETDLKTRVVGNKVGFASPSQFTSAFRMYTGCTPGQYRSRARSGRDGMGY
jgi:AraC-like DNA-binding protein